MNVKSYAGRILCDMQAYINFCDDESDKPSWWTDYGNIIQDDIYGIYQGRGFGPNNAVLVGKKGLWIYLDEEWSLLPYKLIEVVPPLKDGEQNGLTVCISEKEKKLPIDYCLSDAFEFWRFIMRVRDIRMKNGEN